MLKKLTALTFAALGIAACSVEPATTEDLGVLEQQLNSCNMNGLEWKPFVAHLAYDAAEDFGRWEFTTDLMISGDRLVISPAGYSLCASRGRSGCPAVTAGLSAQDGYNEVHNSAGQVIINPNSIRTALVNGFLAQQNNENNANAITDPSEASPYNTFRSPSRTGLPHSISLTNCAVTLYGDFNYGGRSQCLRTGSYRMSDLTVANDATSSIRVRPGMKVTLYEHDAFAGQGTSFTSDQSALWSFNDKTSSLVVSATDSGICSARDTYKVNVSSGSWTNIRGKLVTLGYMRGNDVLDVRLDVPNQTIDVDPFNVDFVPPSQIGGTTYGVAIKSQVAETWRSTDDPWPSIFPVGSSCKKKPYGSNNWFTGTVRSSGAYRYCYGN